MSISLVIAVLSQKGGVGKSTLSRLIARTYASAGWRVKIADFNTKQKTSVDWSALRMSLSLQPEVPAEAFTSIKLAMKQDYDLLIIDGRPDSDTTTLDAAKEANLVIIPCGDSLDDLKPQVMFAHELVARGVNRQKLLFVLNQVSETIISIADARQYVGSAGYPVAKIELPMKAGYKIAQNSGRALTETTFSTLNERAEALAQEIAVRAQQLTGQ